VGPVTAFIDMEFGGICGTWQRMKLPLEAGVVIHEMEPDRIVFSEKQFRFDIDVTVWKNITDEMGRTVGKNPCTMNPAQNRAEDGHVRKIRFNMQERRRAGLISRTIHEELKNYFKGLNGFGISEVVFFAAEYEKTALARAGVTLAGFNVRDLQEEIRIERKQSVLSLDRLSYVIGFGFDGSDVFSTHFRYSVPPAFRNHMHPHDALGDATRIFLAAQELTFHPENLREKIEEYIKICEAETEDLEEGDDCAE